MINDDKCSPEARFEFTDAKSQRPFGRKLLCSSGSVGSSLPFPQPHSTSQYQLIDAGCIPHLLRKSYVGYASKLASNCSIIFNPNENRCLGLIIPKHQSEVGPSLLVCLCLFGSRHFFHLTTRSHPSHANQRQCLMWVSSSWSTTFDAPTTP